MRSVLVAACGVGALGPLALASASSSSLAYSAEVGLVSPAPMSSTNAAYASWNIDPSCNRGFHHINFTNPNLAAAAAGLTPSRLRFGGSGADNLVYGLSPGSSSECAAVAPVACDYVTPGCLNATHWADLYGFGLAARADFMFGLGFGLLQACAAGPSYSWNSSNAAQLLSHLVANGQTGNLWGFELGNEINNLGPGTSCNLQPAQQAAAVLALSKMLTSTLPGAKIIGPDTGYLSALQWLQGYLPLLPPGTLHSITHHVYNGINRANYNSPAQLDNCLPEIAWYTNVSTSLYPGAEIWAGENGPTGGGDDGTCGSHAACGTYATTMWYADDLALRAKHGFRQHQRHDLFGGAYGLVNSVSGAMSLGPTDPVVLRPDFYINFLWKRAVGSSVLNVTSSNAMLRAYAFAGTPPSPFAASQCVGSPLQLLLIQLSNSSNASVALPQAPGGRAKTFAAWTLGPLAGQPEGPFTLLPAINGAPAAVTVDVSKGNPSSFLSGITQPARMGSVAAGVTLPPISTTFLCYIAA